MAAADVATGPAESARTERRAWVFGPVPDLLLGCGLGYLLLIGVTSQLSVDSTTLIMWGTLASLFTGMPHYGATLLRVYEHREDRRRYALFAVWASLVVWGAFVWGVYDRVVGSVLLTIYLTWSPWHYTGQNYGLAVMFLRRAGVDVDPATKRILYLSFLLSFLLAALTLHCDPYLTYDVVGFTYYFMPVRLPIPVYAHLFLGVLVVYAGAVGLSAWRLRHAGRALAPAAALVVTQALWFSLPAFALWLTGRTLDAFDVAFLFIWIAIGHSVQYLWITTYYAAGSDGTGARARYLAKTLLAGAIVWTLPTLVFTPAVIGESTYQLGLFMLVASAVNLQHFVLDGAIWKLRDGPVARILLAKAKPDLPEPIRARSGLRLGRPAFWAVGGLCTLIAVASPALYSLVWRPAMAVGDGVRAERVERLLAWVGRDEPAFWNRRAAERLSRGDTAGARELYEKSLDLYPNPEAWRGLASIHTRQNRPHSALEALYKSIEVSPTGRAWSEIGAIENQRGNHDAAGEALEKAVQTSPGDPFILQRYGVFWLERGDREKAVAALQLAAYLDPKLPWIERDLERAQR